MGGRRTELSEEYLSQVAHEFRGSLNAILGWAEFLRRGPCDDAARARAAETIIRHAKQQTWMIGELLDTWRQASGRLTFAPGTFELWPAVKDALDAVEPIARARSVRFETIGSASAGKLRGDQKRLTQALTSMLANAVHFSPDHSVVRVELELGAGASRVTIHDAGPPVAPAALPFLFDRDRPVGVPVTPRATFRLGLSLVRDVIIRHGGSLEAESGAEGDGMTFRIVLPTETPAAAVAAPREGAAGTGDFAPVQLQGLRVLLVDDEPDAREALTAILNHSGATVEPAASAAEAINALQHRLFDVLLADIGMPGADGYDLIKYVRGLESAIAHMPAVAVTAFASDADRRRALDAGFQVHLAKPVDPAALVATVAVVGGAAASR